MDSPNKDFYQKYYPGSGKKGSLFNSFMKISGYGLGLLIVLTVGFYLSILIGVFGKLPNADELDNIQDFNASEIFSSDNVLLGKYYIKNRSRVTYEEISKDLIHALVATEDARFYEHNGLDNRSLLRVIFKSILLGDENAGGGSTISQQLAKNLYPRKSYSFLTMPVNKIKEILIAKKLEKQYSKDEILALYLNTVSFGENVFGIGVATQRFFNAEPNNIKIEEAAVLVGMLKATTFYNPRKHPERSMDRRNVVLEQMVKYEYLAQTKADSIKQIPLELDYTNATSSDGLAPYFRQHIGNYLKKWLQENPGPDGKPYSLYSDGLKIYTTIDSRLQKLAEEAVTEHMTKLQTTFEKHWKNKELWKSSDNRIVNAMRQSQRYIDLKAKGLSEEEIKTAFEKPRKIKVWTMKGLEEREMSSLDSIIYYQSFLHAGFLAMEPKTGYVRAWVGGINYERFQYDHVMSRRQVGSTFKPFVYAAALEEGLEPCSYIENVKTVYQDYKNWSPGNADNKYEGYYSMQGGLTNSVNTISASIMMEAGVGNVHNFTSNIGFTSDIPREPSIVLGTAELSLIDMLGAYSAFANHGERSLPVYITRIEDSQENILFELNERELETKKVMTQRSADIMNYMLRSVVDSGTAKRLRTVYGLRSQIGGKTGTTQDQTDGWFIGITPHLVAGAWVGGEEQNVRFRSLGLGQGANTALPIYGLFMQKVYKDPRYRNTSNATFKIPFSNLKEELDCPMYSLRDPEKNELYDLFEMLKKRQEEKRKWREERDQLRRDQREDRRQKRRSKWDEFFKKKKGRTSGAI